MPPVNWPVVLLEAAFAQAVPVQPPGTFVLDDVTNGKLNTGLLGGDNTYSTLTQWLRSGSVTRSSTRTAGPLYQYSPGTMTAILNNKDGRFDPDNLAGPYVAAGASELQPMVPVRVRVVWGGITYPLFDGFADSWVPEDGTNYGGRYAEATVTATDAQKILAGIRLAATAAQGGGEFTGSRINRVLTAMGWYTGSGRAQIARGDSTVQATTFDDSAWNLCQLASDSEIGELYVSASGAMVFRNRNALFTDTRSNTPQAIFGDNGAEKAYRRVTRSRDDTTISNDVQATRVGGQLQEAFDNASILKYLFARTFNRSDLILQDDTTTLNWAQWILYVAKNDEDRFDELVLFPLRDPVNLWPQALGREIGDRIRILRRPPGVVGATPWSLTNNYGAAPANTFTIPTSSVPLLMLGDRFQIRTSGGVLKEPTTFTIAVIGADFFGNTAIAFAPYAQAVLAVNDVVTQTGGTVIKDCFIRGISHAWDVSAGTWETRWTLQDASRYGSFFSLDNPALGRLNSNALAY